MVASNKGWIGVDFDGTLADYSQGWQGPEVLGEPVPAMLERVKRWLADGREVRIFTARVWPHAFILPGAELRDLPIIPGIGMRSEVVDDSARSIKAIQRWCSVHFGQVLPITCVKDLAMVELYDDRCVQVEANTGRLIGSSSRGIPA